jgi:hypothetical protein
MVSAASLVLLLGLSPRAGLAASPPPAAEIASAKRALHAAVSWGGTREILEVRARFAAVAAAQPRLAAPHYWLALADWRVVPRLGATSAESAERYCTEGLAEIGRVLEREPKNAEALALRASLLGMSLQFHPASMMTLGPEIEAATQRALAAGPQNPRVQLLAGLNTLNKPAFVGGGAKPALAQLEKSQQLFEAVAAPADSTAPDWGRDDAYLWAGRAAMKSGDAAAARAFYLKALGATPDHGWVRHQLMPEAEKALASGAAAR